MRNSLFIYEDLNPKMKLNFIILILLTIFSSCTTELLTIGGYMIGSALFGGGIGIYNWKTVKDITYCKIKECCNEGSIPYNVEDLKIRFNDLYGQPLALEILKILSAHKKNVYSTNKNKKPLVISMHGWTGVGKNYCTSMIVKSMYKQGWKSKYVLTVNGNSYFQDRNLNETKMELFESIEAVVSSCDKSLIIFDEIEKMPSGVIDVIKNMIDHYNNVRGVEYRNSVFIFISNIGGTLITERLLELYDEGKTRDELEFSDFEKLLRDSAYQEGGFEKSYTIANHLIDHYIPFLPLEQQHVKKCTEQAFKTHDIDPTEKMIEDILNSYITYGPPERPIFANSGCKRIEKQVDYAAEKIKWEL